MVNYATEAELRRRGGYFTRKSYAEGGGQLTVADTTIELDHDSSQIISIILLNDVTTTTFVNPTHYTFVEPRVVILVTPVASDDVFFIKYGTELHSDDLDDSLEMATNIVKSFLEDRYGETLLTTWETTTPPLIKHYTLRLAAVDSQRTLMRDAHKIVPTKIESLDREWNTLMRILNDIKKGKTDVPGEDAAGDRSNVIRGLDSVSIFESQTDMRKVNIDKVDADQGLDGSAFD